ncbi:MAG: hypothetical protein HQK51_10650 [Oligoflexia bacterium]|nr:hypothetical protein [Oligoflexia bacterium]
MKKNFLLLFYLLLIYTNINFTKFNCAIASNNNQLNINKDEIEKTLNKLEDKGLVSFDEANRIRDELKNSSSSPEKLMQIMSKINENQKAIKVRKDTENKMDQKQKAEQMEEASSLTSTLMSKVKSYANNAKRLITNVVEGKKSTNNINNSANNNAKNFDKKTIIQEAAKLASKIDGLEDIDLKAIEESAQKKEQQLDSIDENSDSASSNNSRAKK